MEKLYQYQDFEFFWGTEHPFSQWHASSFEVRGIQFNCAEQFMMYQKAALFDDKEMASEILKATNPAIQKKLGRKVRNFDQQTWLMARIPIVYNANYAKFTQNENLLKFLLGTKGKWIVEASPVDRIWGIGLSVNDKEARQPDKWRGENLLGQVLMTLRANLLSFSQ